MAVAFLAAAAIAAPLCVSTAGSPGAPGWDLAATDETLEEIYRQGIPFSEFMENATRRKTLWDRNYGDGEVPEDILSRARALSGTWRILAIAEDWCSDSVNTVPFLALLAEATATVELRVVNSEVGQAIMEAHLTPDGRPATPTVLILDEEYDEAGCWVERPSELQAWAMENREALGDEFGPQKMAWYREDAGRSTLDEVVAVLEGAAAGRPICEKG